MDDEDRPLLVSIESLEALRDALIDILEDGDPRVAKYAIPISLWVEQINEAIEQD